MSLAPSLSAAQTEAQYERSLLGDVTPQDTAPPDVAPPLPADAPIQPETPSAPTETITTTEPAQQGGNLSDQEINSPYSDALHYPVSSWPVSVGQSPLFGTETIAGFSESEMLRSRWSLRPHAGLATSYDGNIFISNRGEQSDFIISPNAGLTLRVGHPEARLFLIADVTLGAQLYVEHSSQDSLEGSASMNLLANFEKLTLGFQGSVQSGSVTSVDVGTRVYEITFSGGINASYVLGEKISLTGNLYETVATFDNGFIDTESTQVETYINYQLRPKLNVGLGGGLGYLVVEGEGSQITENFSARLLYNFSEKVSVTAGAGIEFREYGAGEETQPIFDIGVNWAVRAGTSIEASAQRSTFASASLQNQDYVATGLSLGVMQRINDHLSVSFATGYQNQVYEASAANVSASREDNYFYFRPGAQIALANRVTMNVYYEYSENLSSGAGAAEFSRDRLGLDLNFLF